MTTINHAERDHALLSASSAHRWLKCTASARLEDTLPDNAGEAAKRGTLAHEAAEIKAAKYFIKGIGPKTYQAKINELRKHELWIDDIEDWAEYYLDALKEIARRHENIHVTLEQRVDYSHIAPGGFGTADFIAIAGSTLYIRDFKTGQNPRNKVAAEDNPQLMLYALGALARYSIIYKIDRVNFGIIQPPLDHITEAEMSADDLVAFGRDIRPIAQEAFDGPGEYNPGDHCQFCRARATCRARAEYQVKNIFAIDKKPDTLSNDEIGQYLTDGKNLAAWLKDLEKHALNESLAGRPIAGYKAIQTLGNRRWIDQDQAMARLINDLKVDEALIYERKPATLSQIEKIIGKPAFKDLEDLVERPMAAPKLVPEDHKGEAITNPTAAELFESEEE